MMEDDLDELMIDTYQEVSMMEDDLDELMIDTYQDSGILEERKWAWWKTILMS